MIIKVLLASGRIVEARVHATWPHKSPTKQHAFLNRHYGETGWHQWFLPNDERGIFGPEIVCHLQVADGRCN
jgi:hypothetical protein